MSWRRASLIAWIASAIVSWILLWWWRRASTWVSPHGGAGPFDDHLALVVGIDRSHIHLGNAVAAAEGSLSLEEEVRTDQDSRADLLEEEAGTHPAQGVDTKDNLKLAVEHLAHLAGYKGGNLAHHSQGIEGILDQVAAEGNLGHHNKVHLVGEVLRVVEVDHHEEGEVHVAMAALLEEVGLPVVEVLLLEAVAPPLEVEALLLEVEAPPLLVGALLLEVVALAPGGGATLAPCIGGPPGGGGPVYSTILWLAGRRSS